MLMIASIVVLSSFLVQFCFAAVQDGSCARYGCGGRPDFARSCQCNWKCADHGDCCSDFAQICATPEFNATAGSCSAQAFGCGGKYDRTRPCQCGWKCADHGDCCSDFVQQCTSPPFDPNAGSCAVYGCGGLYNRLRPCQCSYKCAEKGDCCSDFQDQCPPLTFKECLAAPETTQDRRSNKKQLRVAAFNVNFLFLKGISMLQCPGPDCEWKSKAHARSHIEAVAYLIKQMDVDIMQLSEVEDCDVLDVLVAEIAKFGDQSYRPYLIRGQDSFTGQNVALITRIDPLQDLKRSNATVAYPLPGTNCPRPVKKGIKSVSKHYYTRFHVQGLKKNLTIVGVHFIAQPDDVARCYQREAQATVIQQIVQHAVTEYDDEVIVSGDYNDFDPQVLDIQGNQPISSVLNIIRGAGNGMESVATQVEQSSRFTAWWDEFEDCDYQVPEQVSTLDHMFMSKNLHDRLTNVHIGNDLFQQGCGTLLSDHFPIIATLQLDDE